MAEFLLTALLTVMISGQYTVLLEACLIIDGTYYYEVTGAELRRS